MKRIFYKTFIFLFAFYIQNASAFFFFFIPGKTTQGISDAITGAKGNVCVKENAKVGDVTTSLSGNKMTIISLSGTSSICSNPALPIRAEVDYKFTFSSNAGINLPDDYEPKTITDLQRFNGALLTATSKSVKNKGIAINARAKTEKSDTKAIANAVEKAQIGNLIDSITKNPEQIVIDSLPALRFEVHGKTKGVFGIQMVYVITV